jgi:cyclase
MTRLNRHAAIGTRLGLASALAAAIFFGGALTQGPAQAGTEATAPAPSFGGFEPPEGWRPPPVHPAGAELQTKELAPGVYALLSTKPPVDNSGFVVGERGVLVIDAHINAAMARKIQAAVREVTDKPILYLVNTNAHGDHTFGNYAFPAETTVVAHRKTAEAMRNFEQEKAALLAAVEGDRSVFADVRLRLPDVTFEDSLTIDLGGRVVELHHFGHGNTPGDTVVYVPKAKAAWTGNLVFGVGTVPWAIEGNTPAYLRTVAAFATDLDVETIVPGHGLATSGAILGRYLRYLGGHLDAVQGAINAGLTLEQALAELPLEAAYLPPADSPLAQLGPLMQGFHRWNVKKTYLELNGK